MSTTTRCPECDTVGPEDAFQESVTGQFTCPECGARFYDYEMADTDDDDLDYDDLM